MQLDLLYLAIVFAASSPSPRSRQAARFSGRCTDGREEPGDHRGERHCQRRHELRQLRLSRGLTEITHDNCEELSNITQTPAPAINNGTIVHLGDKAVWNVTGTSYLRGLTVSQDSKVCGTVTVDGKAVSGAGTYTGDIVVNP